MQLGAENRKRINDALTSYFNLCQLLRNENLIHNHIGCKNDLCKKISEELPGKAAISYCPCSNGQKYEIKNVVLDMLEKDSY